MASKSNGKTEAASAKGEAAGLSKQELVRQAINHLGRDAKPLQIQAHIKDKFGIEMSPNHISASKTGILREAKSGAKPVTSTATAKPAAQTVAPKAAPARVVGHEAGNGKKTAGISLHDIQDAKDLVGRVGAGQLRELIDLLAK